MARVRDARATRWGDTHFHCAGAAPVRGGPSYRAKGGRGKGGAPRARCRAGCAYAHPPGVARAEDARAGPELEGKPLGQRACDALAVEAAEGARASAAGRAGVPSGVHPRHLLEGPRGRAVEAAVRLVDDRPHLHGPLQRAVVVGLLGRHVARAVGNTCGPSPGSPRCARPSTAVVWRSAVPAKGTHVERCRSSAVSEVTYGEPTFVSSSSSSPPRPPPSTAKSDR